MSCLNILYRRSLPKSVIGTKVGSLKQSQLNSEVGIRKYCYHNKVTVDKYQLNDFKSYKIRKAVKMIC